VDWKPKYRSYAFAVACGMSESKMEIRYVGDHMARMELHGGCMPITDKAHIRIRHMKLTREYCIYLKLRCPLPIIAFSSEKNAYT
jgi:hypothetical protein